MVNTEMDNKKISDTELWKLLSSQSFNAVTFVREIVKDSIADHDVLATKLKLLALSERTNRQLKENITHNYSKFIETANEMGMLEDEMYKLRSFLSQHQSLILWLKDFVGKEDAAEHQSERRQLMQARSVTRTNPFLADEDIDGYAHVTSLRDNLSFLVEQAESFTMVSSLPVSLKLTSRDDQDDLDGDGAITTSDGRRLLHQSTLSMLDPYSLLTQGDVVLYLLDGCVLICNALVSSDLNIHQAAMDTRRTASGLSDGTSVGSDFTDYQNVDPGVIPSQRIRDQWLDLITALNVDQFFNVVDVRDSVESEVVDGSSTPLLPLKHVFKLIKRGGETIVLKAPSLRSKVECMEALTSHARIVQRHLKSLSGHRMDKSRLESWIDYNDIAAVLSASDDAIPDDATSVVLAETLDKLRLAIAHRRTNAAVDLVLQCRELTKQQLPKVPGDEGIDANGYVALSELEASLIAILRKEEQSLRARCLSGRGLRNPRRQLSLLKRLGYSNDAITMFIEYQKMYIKTLKLGQEEQIDIRGNHDSRFDMVYSAMLTTHTQWENFIESFFAALRKAEAEFHMYFDNDNADCTSAFIVWIKSDVDDMMEQLALMAHSKHDQNFAAVVSLAVFIKSLASGDNKARMMATTGIGEATFELNTDSPRSLDGRHVSQSAVNCLDLTFMLEDKLHEFLIELTKREKNKLLELIRSDNRNLQPIKQKPLNIKVRRATDESGVKWVLPLEIDEICQEFDFYDKLERYVVVSSNRSSPETKITPLPADGCEISATFFLSSSTIQFTKMFLNFAVSCRLMYCDQLQPAIVEGIVELAKMYLKYLGQSLQHVADCLTTPCTDENPDEDLSNVSMESSWDSVSYPDGSPVSGPMSSGGTGFVEKREQRLGSTASFLFTNIEYVITVLFENVDDRFRAVSGITSRYFARIYEKMAKFEQIMHSLDSGATAPEYLDRTTSSSM